MSNRIHGVQAGSRPLRILRNDWLIVPALCMTTLIALIIVPELVARKVFSRSKQTIYGCMRIEPGQSAISAIPNSVCREKNAETPLVEYRFNSCGYRESRGCASFPSDRYSILIVGSSMAFGSGVSSSHTFAARLPQGIQARNSSPVLVYNASIFRERPAALVERFPNLIAMRPKLILWVLSPLDIEEVSILAPPPADPNQPKGALQAARYRILKDLRTKSLPDAMDDIFDSAVAATALRNLMYRSQSFYLRSWLNRTQANNDYLESKMSGELDGKLRILDEYTNQMASLCRASGVQLAVTLLPDRAQATMISMGHWPSSYDPYKLDQEVRAAAERHGAIYLDILPGIRNVPNAEEDYYPVDGHPNAQGHSLIAELLADKLTDGAIPALQARQVK